MNKIILKRFCHILLVLSLLGCGSSSSPSRVSTGAISAKLVWGQKTGQSANKRVASVPSNVVTVRIIVTGPDMPGIQKDFPASAGQGVIDGVPVGSDRVVTVQGLDSGGALSYTGASSSVSVTAGQTTDVGTITMLPVAPTFSNAVLNGAWIISPQTAGQSLGRAYIVFDGKGGISDLSGFNTATPPGTYQVQTDGSFTLTVNYIPGHDPQTIASGKLASPTGGTLSIIQGKLAGETGRIIKVSNPALCRGKWSGLLTESSPSSVLHNIVFDVDGNGVVSSFTGLASPVSGKMFCETADAVAFFRTGETGPYDQLNIAGTLSGNNITGSFGTDTPGTNTGGTAALTRAVSPITLPPGSLSDVPPGDYSITINVCSSGICQSVTSFAVPNSDMNQFVLMLTDGLNMYFSQQAAVDCSQSGCTCPAAVVGYKPWNGSSFMVSVDFSVTCGGSTASASIQYIGTKI